MQKKLIFKYKEKVVEHFKELFSRMFFLTKLTLFLMMETFNGRK